MAAPAGTLVLVPTETERRELVCVSQSQEAATDLKLCGFGPVAAAIGAAGWIVENRPSRVLLLGLAGTFDAAALALGTATSFAGTALEGVGAGSGSDFRTATELGFPLTVIGSEDTSAASGVVPLAVPRDLPRQDLLLTSCAAAGSQADVAARLRRFPAAAAEDMEAFAVALACRRFEVPLAVIRGISNQVGDRRHTEWQVATALQSAWRLAEQALRDPNWEQIA